MLVFSVWLQAGLVAPAFAAASGSAATQAGDSVAGTPSAATESFFGPPVHGGGLGSCVPATVALNTSDRPVPDLPHYLQPSISLSEIYSDNIELAPQGQTRSNYATVVRPGLAGCTTGSRLFARFDSTVEAIRYARNPPKDEVYSQFSGSALSELYADHLFLKANGKYGQTVIDPMAAYSNNNAFATTANRANVWASTLSPYWKQDLGRLGLATLRYSYGRVVYTDTSLNNSRSWGKSFNLLSPASNVDWSWKLDWKSTRVRHAGSGKTDYFDDASLQLGYQLFYNVKVLATGGAENDYKPDGTVKRYGSRFWNAGFRWASPYSSLLVLYGHRFFGHSLTVHANYNAPALRIGMDYTETPTVTSLLQTQSTATPTAVTPLDQLQNTSVFVDKRWNGNVTYLLSRSQLSLGVFDERKYYRPESLGEDRTTGGAVNWAWQATGRTRFNAGFNRERLISDSTTPSGPDFLNTSSMGVTYALMPNAQLSLMLSRQTRRSTLAANTYSANSALVQVSATF